jgi:TM2 domain-containing membrane protein YozV
VSTHLQLIIIIIIITIIIIIIIIIICGKQDGRKYNKKIEAFLSFLKDRKSKDAK